MDLPISKCDISRTSLIVVCEQVKSVNPRFEGTQPVIDLYGLIASFGRTGDWVNTKSPIPTPKRTSALAISPSRTRAFLGGTLHGLVQH